MGAIKQGDWTYNLTPEDKLWAARMVEGEGPATESAAVLWAMTQLFAPAGQRVKYGRPDRFGSFTDLIQAYSQPINPIWRRDGSKCRPGGSNAGAENCSESRLARRDQIASMPMSAIDPQKLAIVDKWFDGTLSNPVPNAIEFAAPNVSRSFLVRNPTWSALAQAGNWFLRPPVDLPTTLLGGGSGLAIAIPVIGAAGVALAAGFAFWAWYRSR